jgi:hypothetical protein
MTGLVIGTSALLLILVIGFAGYIGAGLGDSFH